jgi:XTP/dITP diphosphohydrolase
VSRLLLATTNPGKRAELAALLGPLRAEIVTPDLIGLRLVADEPYATYAENAAAKAEAFCRASGLLTLADDSGLEVAALAWGPGVRTGRWDTDGRGPDRLLETLAGMPDADRRARMVCVLAVGAPIAEGVRTELFSGLVEGRIARSRRGHGGFGYDPVFELPDGRTTAELTDEEKNRVSHRGRAVAAALPRLRELLGEVRVADRDLGPRRR